MFQDFERKEKGNRRRKAAVAAVMVVAITGPAVAANAAPLGNGVIHMASLVNFIPYKPDPKPDKPVVQTSWAKPFGSAQDGQSQDGWKNTQPDMQWQNQNPQDGKNDGNENARHDNPNQYAIGRQNQFVFPSFAKPTKSAQTQNDSGKGSKQNKDTDQLGDNSKQGSNQDPQTDGSPSGGQHNDDPSGQDTGKND